MCVEHVRYNTHQRNKSIHCQYDCKYGIMTYLHTATVTYWLEHLPHEQEVVDSILSCDRPKSLKLVVLAFPLGAQDYGNGTMTGSPVSG